MNKKLLNMVEIESYLNKFLHSTKHFYINKLNIGNQMKTINKNNKIPTIQTQFSCNKNKQKLLIDALLKCSIITIKDISTLIKVSPDFLLDVYQGKEYLNKKNAINLMYIFLLLFSE